MKARFHNKIDQLHCSKTKVWAYRGEEGQYDWGVSSKLKSKSRTKYISTLLHTLLLVCESGWKVSKFFSFFFKEVISWSWSLAESPNESQPFKMSPEQCWLPHRPCFPAQFGLNNNIMKMHSKNQIPFKKITYSEIALTLQVIYC